MTEAYASIGNLDAKPIPVDIDSGSDITLISQKTLDRMLKAPKVWVGQRIKFIQVTGKTIITGYVILDLIFKTPQGPVKINVEAYVVKGMSAEFILGNDFSNQYSISIVCDKGESSLIFGKSGRSVVVHNSLTMPFLDEDRHTFKLRVRPDITNRILKSKTHWKSQVWKKQIKHQQSELQVQSQYQVSIPPESSRLVEVCIDFDNPMSTLFIERSFISNGNLEELYGCTNMLID